MLDSKVAAGASHAGHDFVGNQKNVVPSADLSDRLQVSRGRNDGSERCAADRFEDERCRLAVARFNGAFQLGCVLLPAVAASVGAVKGTAVAVRHADVRELADHRQIHFAAAFVARNRKSAKRCAVIALVTAKNLMTPRLSDFYLILT